MFKSIGRVLRREWHTVKTHLPLFMIVLLVGYSLGMWYQSDKADHAKKKDGDFEPGIGRVLYGKYRNVPNSDLEKKTFEVVGVLREGIRSNREEEIQLRHKCDRELASATTDQVRSVIRKKCNEESDLSVARLLSQYEQKYKADVVILREQLIQRVSGSGEKREAILFWYPTNQLGLEQVASGLELLAKQLPKDGK